MLPFSLISNILIFSVCLGLLAGVLTCMLYVPYCLFGKHKITKHMYYAVTSLLCVLGCQLQGRLDGVCLRVMASCGLRSGSFSN